MKKLLAMCAVLVIGVSLLTGCAHSDRRDVGMIAGGVVGGLAGNALTGGSTAGTIVGAVGGGYVGRELAR